MKRALLLLCLPALGWAMGTPPQKPATPGRDAAMVRDEDLRSDPQSSARVMLRLGKGQKVRLLTDSAGWSQVVAAGQTGWVRILSVRAADTGADLGGLAQAASTPGDASRAVAVAGVRGLDEASLAVASFNAADLDWLDQLALGRAEATQFAQAAGLTPRAMAYPAPAETPSPSWRNEQP